MTPRAIAVGAADYADGSYFAYAYDEVGNRTSEVACWGGGSCTPITTTYAYDDANRLIEVDGQPYTWDANGNLISFGSTTYSYDAANRLTDYVVQLGPSAYYGESYTYNGLGDRVQRTVYPSIGGTSVTTYTLDLAAGLTQVLADGTYTYLYGQGRIAQFDGAGFDYFLGDALGSVRQLADESGAVTLARRYEPYGDGLESAGTGATSYDFTGELRDSGAGLIYLRARFMQPSVGRFITRDTWAGGYTQPQSLNRWGYVLGNPLKYTDPSGHREDDGCEIEGCVVSEIEDDCLICLSTSTPTPTEALDLEQCITNPAECPLSPSDTHLGEGTASSSPTSPICTYGDYYYCGAPNGARSPDYVNVTVGFSLPGLGALLAGHAEITVDRFGNVYVGGGGSLGPEAAEGLSVSATGGWVLDGPPGEGRSENFLTGGYFNASGGVAIGGGYTMSFSSSDSAGEFGLFWPQLSFNIGAAFILINASRTTPLWEP